MKVRWQVEYSAQFELWWATISEKERDGVDRIVIMLEELGPSLPFPYSSGIVGSEHRHMRELRLQVRGRPIRILYAFDPRRVAILLIGGNKGGNARWYKEAIPQAERIYSMHLQSLTARKLQ